MSFKIVELRAYISVGPDGDEGVMACSAPLASHGHPATMIPLIAADEARFNALKPMADMVSKATGTPYVVKRFRLVTP